jgi:ketosteroid isomerase-like protein
MDDKEILLSAFEKMRKALFDCDVQALQELIAEDYIGYDPNGNPQDRKMTLEAYQPGGAQLDIYDVEGVEVRIAGEIGIITGRGYIHGTFADAEFEHDLRFLDIYIMRDDAWKLYISQVTPLGSV